MPRFPFLLLALLVPLAGCASPCMAVKCGAFSPAWEKADAPACQTVSYRAPARSTPHRSPVGAARIERAEVAFERAESAARQGNACAVDHYYEAATQAWHILGSRGSAANAWRIYHASVEGLLTEGQHHGRLKCGKLTVHQGGSTIAVPIACLGLPFETEDVNHVLVVERSRRSKLARYYACEGLGVPVTAIRDRRCRQEPNERFFPPRLPFGATAVLRPDDADGAVLEFYNPLTISSAPLDGRSTTIARDSSAPLELRLGSPENTGLLAFLQPGEAEEEGLRFLEPYQPGKIPVVFVHGLLSDPTTWFDIANDLRQQAWFNERYQVWGFRYATGRPFLTSAALLRSELRDALAQLDPDCEDPALRQMVLVGHSMGGLVSKLQVTHSEAKIWDSYVNVPLESLRASPQAKSILADRSFFDPQPAVRRVVFIATPHGGSSWASRGVGRISSALVEPSPEIETMHRDLVEDNPGAFSPLFERKVPTSVDLLEPKDPTLEIIRTLRIAKGVTLHSIIGTGVPSLLEGPGDGVISARDARHAGVSSERFLEVSHTTILARRETSEEMATILREHLKASGR